MSKRFQAAFILLFLSVFHPETAQAKSYQIDVSGVSIASASIEYSSFWEYAGPGYSGGLVSSGGAGSTSLPQDFIDAHYSVAPTGSAIFDTIQGIFAPFSFRDCSGFLTFLCSSQNIGSVEFSPETGLNFWDVTAFEYASNHWLYIGADGESWARHSTDMLLYDTGMTVGNTDYVGSGGTNLYHSFSEASISQLPAPVPAPLPASFAFLVLGCLAFGAQRRLAANRSRSAS
jgi:hypothetical protein